MRRILLLLTILVLFVVAPNVNARWLRITDVERNTVDSLWLSPDDGVETDTVLWVAPYDDTTPNWTVDTNTIYRRLPDIPELGQIWAQGDREVPVMRTGDPIPITPPKEQPAGMVASLEFTDVWRTDRGPGMLGRQGYAGFYYRLTPRLTGIALGSYGENPLEQGGELSLITTKATVLFNIFKATRAAGYKYEFSIFLIGAVGNSWADFTDDGAGSIQAFLTSTGIGVAVPAGTGYAAAYIRLDQSPEYQQLIIGFGFTIPFLINP